MALVPLGFRSSHVQRRPLGSTVQFLQPLAPLGQSVSPLGQDFQPLQPLPPLSPFVQASLKAVPPASERRVFSEFNFSSDTFSDSTNSAIAPALNHTLEPSQSQSPSETNPEVQSSLIQTQIDSDEPVKPSLDLSREAPISPPNDTLATPLFNVSGNASDNASGNAPDSTVSQTLRSPSELQSSSIAENLAQLKPLGALPPLVQASDFLISAQSRDISSSSLSIPPEPEDLNSETVIRPRLESPVLETNIPERKPALTEFSIHPQRQIDRPSPDLSDVAKSSEAPQLDLVQSAEDNLFTDVSSVKSTVQRVELEPLSRSPTGTETIPITEAEERSIASDQTFINFQQEDSPSNVSETLQPTLDITEDSSEVSQERQFFADPSVLPEPDSTDRSPEIVANSSPQPTVSARSASEIALEPQEETLSHSSTPETSVSSDVLPRSPILSEPSVTE